MQDLVSLEGVILFTFEEGIEGLRSELIGG